MQIKAMMISGPDKTNESASTTSCYATDSDYFASFEFNMETISRCFFGRETDILDDHVP